MDEFTTAFTHIQDALESVFEAAAAEAANNASQGTHIIEKKNAAVTAAEKLRAAHNRHEQAQKIISILARYSIINKIGIMAPAFAASLLVPASVKHVLRPVFILLGAHLGVEAVDKTREMWNTPKQHASPQHRVHPGKILGEKILKKDRLAHVLEKAILSDRMMTFDLTGALLGSIYTKPVSEQIGIMFVYAGAIVTSVFGVMAGLVKMEDWGQRLPTWKPDEAFRLRAEVAEETKKPYETLTFRIDFIRSLRRTGLPRRLGFWMQDAAPVIKHYVPSISSYALFVTSGRVIAHGSAFFEGLVDHVEHMAEVLPRVGGLLPAFIGETVVWGLTGLTIGVAVKLAEHHILHPLKLKLKLRKPSSRYRAYVRKSFLRKMSHRTKNTIARQFNNWMNFVAKTSRLEPRLELLSPVPIVPIQNESLSVAATDIVVTDPTIVAKTDLPLSLGQQSSPPGVSTHRPGSHYRNQPSKIMPHP